MDTLETATRTATPSAPTETQPRRWRPVIKVLPIISGFLLGVGLLVLRQQYGVAPLTTGGTVVWSLVGLTFGLVVPSAVEGIVVTRERTGGDRTRHPDEADAPPEPDASEASDEPAAEPETPPEQQEREAPPDPPKPPPDPPPPPSGGQA